MLAYDGVSGYSHDNIRFGFDVWARRGVEIDIRSVGNSSANFVLRLGSGGHLQRSLRLFLACREALLSGLRSVKRCEPQLARQDETSYEDRQEGIATDANLAVCRDMARAISSHSVAWCGSSYLGPG